MNRLILAVMGVLLLASCSLFSGDTQVRFRNATISQTLLQVNFGSASYGNILSPGDVTNYFSILPGQNDFFAERQDGTQTANMLFQVTGGYKYTLTLSDSYQANIVLSSFPAGDTITINMLVFTATNGATMPSTRNFSVASGDNYQSAAELSKCVDDPVYGVPGVTASAFSLVSTTGPISVTSTGSCIPYFQYQMVVTLVDN